MATDTLEIFGTEFTNVTGIKATDDQSGTKVYIRPQGNLPITANSASTDVTQYATVSVNVPSSGVDIPTFNIVLDSSYTTRTVTCNKTFAECFTRYTNADSCAYVHTYVDSPSDDWEQFEVATAVDAVGSDYIAYVINGPYGPIMDIMYYPNGTITIVEPSAYSTTLTATANGEYYPTKGVYSNVIVNVASGSSKNTQVVQGTTRTNASALTAIGAELTVSKTGTYDIYYSCFRTNTSSSYTWATQLYINGTAYGTAENTTWTNNQQNTHLSNISLTAGDKLRVYGRETRGTSYYVCAPMLVIIEA